LKASKSDDTYAGDGPRKGIEHRANEDPAELRNLPTIFERGEEAALLLALIFLFFGDICPFFRREL
jgi:hypothetical protein